MTTQELWQSQLIEAPRLSLEYIRHLAGNLERGIRRRAALNYIVCALACGFYGWAGWQFASDRPLLLGAVAWYGFFAIYVMIRLRRYVASQTTPKEAGVLDTLRFYRKQLERQRDFRRWSWQWGIPAMFPGLALQIAAMIVYAMPRKSFVQMIVVVVVWSVVGSVATEARARRSQREIDALDSLAKGG